jgi:hypothetical protein
MATPPLPPGFVLESEAPTAGLPELPPGFELEGPPIQDMPAMSVQPDEYSERSGMTRAQRQAQIAQVDAEQAARQASFDREQQFGRAAGLTGRTMLKGLAVVPDIVASPLAGLANRILPESMQQTDVSGLVDAFVNRVGGVTPQTAGERLYSDVVGGITGAVLPVGVGRQLMQSGSQVVRGVGQMLAAQPGLQMASSATGSGAASATREGGGGTGAQIAAGLAGGLTPAGVTSGLPALARGGLRGGEAGRQRVAENIRAFGQAGTAPSVGQATESGLMRGAEQTLSRLPGGAGVMNRRAQQQAEEIGAGLEQTAAGLSQKTTAGEAGRSVTSGILDKENAAAFMPRTRAVADTLYQKVDATIPQGTRVGVESTRGALKDLNASIEGAPNVSKFFQNARIQGIEGALLEDIAGASGALSRPEVKQAADAIRAQLTQEAKDSAEAVTQYGAQIRQQLQAEAQQTATENARLASLGLNQQMKPVQTQKQIEDAVKAATSRFPKPLSNSEIEDQVSQYLSSQVDDRLPYEALTKLRTLVGNEIDNYSLVDNVPRSKWKALYGALSKDMETAAATPEAKAAWQRANNYYNARLKRLEVIDSAVSKNGGPEKVFNAIYSSAKDGDTTLRAVMQSLPKEGQRDLTAAFVRRLGRANPSAQTNEGDAFSAATFLTNWNRISPEAKRTLFDRHGPMFSSNMDRIAKVASNLREGSSTFANPSGTAAAGAQIAGITSFVTSLATGNPGLAAGIAATAGGSNLWARAMTNPRFVAWLAEQTKAPLGAIPAQMNVLRGIAERQKEPELSEIADLIESGYQAEQQKQKQQ